MSIKEDFEFLNSSIWLKYTQERYTPLDDIKYRLDSLGLKQDDWESLKIKILGLRKLNSVPFFVNCLDKKFWFFPADCINKKIRELEFLGNKLFERINNQKTFKEEFLMNSSIEEAITSAIYEGANSTRAKAKQLISSGKKPMNKDEWMLVNNYRVLNWIKDNCEEDISIDSILKVHSIVTQNTLDGDDANFCGKFRNDKVFVGNNHEGIEYNKIIESINEALVLTTSNKRDLAPIVKGILLHYFIAYIHPFFDGNGRTARAFFYYKAIKNKLHFVELLSISAHLKEHGKRYEKSFELVTENDYDLTFFVDFCLDSLLNAIQKVQKKVDYLISLGDLKDYYKLNANQISVLQRHALNRFKPITIEDYAKHINKSREIARKDLKQLLALGFVREEKQGKKFIFFIDRKKIQERKDAIPVRLYLRKKI